MRKALLIITGIILCSLLVSGQSGDGSISGEPRSYFDEGEGTTSHQECRDYCSNNIFYARGSFNQRSAECAYDYVERCEFGCDSFRSGCAAPPKILSCDNYCKNSIVYEKGEFDQRRQICIYERRVCEYGCAGDICAKPPEYVKEETKQEEKKSEEPLPPPPPPPPEEETKEDEDRDGHKQDKQEEENHEDQEEPKKVTVTAPAVGGSPQGTVSGDEESEQQYSEQPKINPDVIGKEGVSTIEPSIINDKVYFDITSNPSYSIFGIFTVKGKSKKTVESDSGEVVKEDKSWWSNLPGITILLPLCKTQQDCNQHEDGDLCNGQLYCDVNEGVCKVNPATVPFCHPGEDNTCQKNACNPSTGKCEAKYFDGNSCSSGEECMTPGVCQQGECTTQKWNYNDPKCQCMTQDDCNQYENGNKCDGTLYCDLKTHQCVLNPATVVKCYSGNDNQCQQNKCNPSTGKCEMALLDGQSCASNEECMTDGICKEGSCEGIAFDYDDPECECQNNGDCGSYDNNNVCDGVKYCDKAAHKCLLNPASVITCPSVADTACRRNTCNPVNGSCAMQNQPDGFPCDDDNPCTTKDSCQKGECISEWDYSVCECKGHANCTHYEDDDECTGEWYCNKLARKCEQNNATIPAHCYWD